MRTRSFAAALSLAAAAALVLAGCASGGTQPDSSASASPAAAGDLCAAAAPSGAASDAVTVEGAAGAAPTVTFATPLEVTGFERTVETEGSGTKIASGDYVSVALAAFDPATGQQLGAVGYDDGAATPQLVTADSVLGEMLGCAGVGSRIVGTLPANGSTATAAVYVFDVLDVVPADQWCTPVPFDGNAPAVTFGDNGAPTITIPATDPPAGVAIEVLTPGDGATVASGDNVEVNYTGVKWSDGSTFDSSWERGQTATFPTTGVVTGFQRALEGQQVGSTVLVSMPPECGYGPTPSAQQPLGGETLVFVVNIVAIATE